MTDLFPIIQPEVVQEETELPLYREVKWDFEKGEPVFRGGEPVVAEGAEAIKTWVWKALVTERARYEIYSWNFGSEVESLIGQPYTDELKRAERSTCGSQKVSTWLRLSLLGRGACRRMWTIWRKVSGRCFRRIWI